MQGTPGPLAASHTTSIVAVCSILAQMDPASSEGIANVLQRLSVASRSCGGVIDGPGELCLWTDSGIARQRRQAGRGDDSGAAAGSIRHIDARWDR